MSTKVLAFFDARFCMSGPLWEALGKPNHWRHSLEARPVRGFHSMLMTPSLLGAYDLARPEQAAAVVNAARGAGLAGFVLDCYRSGDGFVTGAPMLAPFCDQSFALAFQWDNGPRPLATSDRLDWQAHRRDLAALIAAISPWPHARLGGRPVLIVRRPHALAEPALTVSLLRHEANAAGLPGLYIIANAAEEVGRLSGAGFDALVDPDPAEWISCDKAVADDGFAFLQIMAGQEDPGNILDTALDYRTFAGSRMVNRLQRGKVLPRVLPGFSDWPDHVDGGAVMLVNNIHPSFYRAFLHKSIAVVSAAFPADEQAVFLESWNGWRHASQIEPTTRRGDAMLRHTRQAIEWGSYLAATQQPHVKPAEWTLEMRTRARIDALCADLALTVTGQG